MSDTNKDKSDAATPADTAAHKSTAAHAAAPKAAETKAHSAPASAAKAPSKKAAERKPKRAKATPARQVRAAARPATAKNSNTNSRKPNRGTQTMTNQTNKAAERVEAAFGDVNNRAKIAVAKTTQVAEEMTDLTKGNVEALVASSKIAAKGLETLGQGAADYSRRSFEEASAALKSFAEVKSPTDFFKLQGDFARSAFDSWVAQSSKASEAVLKIAGEVAEPITGRYAIAAERVKSAAL